MHVSIGKCVQFVTAAAAAAVNAEQKRWHDDIRAI